MTLEMMVYIFIGCVIFIFILMNEGWPLCFMLNLICNHSTIDSISGVTGDRVGLAITQSLTLTGLLQWGVRQSRWQFSVFFFFNIQ